VDLTLFRPIALRNISIFQLLTIRHKTCCKRFSDASGYLVTAATEKFMTQMSKFFLEFVSAAIILHAQAVSVSAITLSNESYNFESRQCASTGTGRGEWGLCSFTDADSAALSPPDTVLLYVKLSRSESGPEGLSINETLMRCDFDPYGCGSITGSPQGDGTGMTAGGSDAPTTDRIAAGSTGNSSGEGKGISELELLLLLLVGVIGLSRLRGRRIE
jgi:hypothetical protein